uniref:Uncharacterized protein n=1 Tax=Sphaerodactylus townsendi TaxID=933632 RepID=A0ACB8EP60_9SAUR
MTAIISFTHFKAPTQFKEIKSAALIIFKNGDILYKNLANNGRFPIYFMNDLTSKFQEKQQLGKGEELYGSAYVWLHETLRYILEYGAKVNYVQISELTSMSIDIIKKNSLKYVSY